MVISKSKRISPRKLRIKKQPSYKDLYFRVKQFCDIGGFFYLINSVNLIPLKEGGIVSLDFSFS